MEQKTYQDIIYKYADVIDQIKDSAHFHDSMEDAIKAGKADIRFTLPKEMIDAIEMLMEQ